MKIMINIVTGDITYDDLKTYKYFLSDNLFQTSLNYIPEHYYDLDTTIFCVELANKILNRHFKTIEEFRERSYAEYLFINEFIKPLYNTYKYNKQIKHVIVNRPEMCLTEKQQLEFAYLILEFHNKFENIMLITHSSFIVGGIRIFKKTYKMYDVDITVESFGDYKHKTTILNNGKFENAGKLFNAYGIMLDNLL